MKLMDVVSKIVKNIDKTNILLLKVPWTMEFTSNIYTVNQFKHRTQHPTGVLVDDLHMLP